MTNEELDNFLKQVHPSTYTKDYQEKEQPPPTEHLRPRESQSIQICKEIEANDLLLSLDDDEPLPPFPLDTLPQTFRAPIEEVMRHYRVPALIPAVCALVVNSAALGRGIVTKSNVRRTYPKPLRHHRRKKRDRKNRRIR